MKRQHRCRSYPAFLVSLMMGYYPAAAGAQSTNPLEVEQHPESPRYESIFPDQVVPLDTRLSWKHRFLGNVTFNQDEALPLTSPEFELQRTTDRHGSEAPAASAVFDASGTVKQIRTSEGKIKIDHGPIAAIPGLVPGEQTAPASGLIGMQFAG